MVHRAIFKGERECDLCGEHTDNLGEAVQHLVNEHPDEVDGAASAGEIVSEHMTDVREEV
jgi:hypothetical protein